MRAPTRLLRTGIAVLALTIAAPAFADHLDELILFDQSGAERKLDEGLVRQRLGLLNADGQPALPLVALVSADGKRAAYDTNGAMSNPSFDSRLVELKGDGGSLVLITHGNTGIITMERKIVKGFGTGTGSMERWGSRLGMQKIVREGPSPQVAWNGAARGGNSHEATAGGLFLIVGASTRLSVTSSSRASGSAPSRLR